MDRVGVDRLLESFDLLRWLAMPGSIPWIFRRTVEGKAAVELEEGTACAGTATAGTSGKRTDVEKLLAVGEQVGGSGEKSALLSRVPWRSRISSEKDVSENPPCLALLPTWRS